MSGDARELQGRIGVAGAVFALVGYIIGGSIFILPGELAGQVGPAVFLAYLIAAGLALFVCFAAAQIGSAFPMSGGTYVAVSSVVSPRTGCSSASAAHPAPSGRSRRACDVTKAAIS